MENLIEKLEGLGFTKNFLQIVKEQNLSEFSVPDIDIVEYSTYDDQVNYNSFFLYSDNIHLK